LSPANQAKLQSSFRVVIAKMAVIGQNTKTMIDYSDVIPVLKPVVGKPHLPAGKAMKDIDQAASVIVPQRMLFLKSFPAAVRNRSLPNPDRSRPTDLCPRRLSPYSPSTSGV
jgi:hypothetical protein